MGGNEGNRKNNAFLWRGSRVHKKEDRFNLSIIEWSGLNDPSRKFAIYFWKLIFHGLILFFQR